MECFKKKKKRNPQHNLQKIAKHFKYGMSLLKYNSMKRSLAATLMQNSNDIES